MAFTALTTGALQQNKTAGTTYAPVWVTTYDVGTLGIMTIALDNIGTTDGDLGDVLSVTDAKSNTWVKLIEFTNGQGTAGAGATISVWYTIITTAVTGGDVITITFNGTVTAKAVSMRGFSMGSGSTINLAASATLANDAVDAGSMSLSPLVNKEYLFIRAIAGESNGIGVGSPETSWNGLGTNVIISTSGGGAVSNMSIYSEYRIFSTTSIISNPTTAAIDQASVLLAIEEVASGGGGGSTIKALGLLGVG
jgi:hypothetical protein